jgi:hypothetical protein
MNCLVGKVTSAADRKQKEGTHKWSAGQCIPQVTESLSLGKAGLPRTYKNTSRERKHLVSRLTPREHQHQNSTAQIKAPNHKDPTAAQSEAEEEEKERQKSCERTEHILPFPTESF